MKGDKIRERGNAANVKLNGPESRGFSQLQLSRFFSCIGDYRHKLMLRVIYETGCRVGEFVAIQVKHIDFDESCINFPAENTKTRTSRKGIITEELMNELMAFLAENGLRGKRNGCITDADAYLFTPTGNGNRSYSTNRIRQIVRRYIEKAGLDETYAQRTDANGREMSFHRLTVHSLRHSHISHSINALGLPIPIVQKQVGHKNLETTAAYSATDWDTQARAYREARQ